MLPSILPGDFLVASKVRAKQLKRGAVVALRCPVPKDKLCIKRIVGLPGDRIEFRGNNLILNGQAAKYVASGAFETEIVDGMGWAIWPGKAEKGIGEAVVLPPQQIYVLNDKRSDLEDSRVWGPVAVDYLEARVQRVWMSLDWYDGNKVRLWPRIRWERLFRSID